MYVDAECYCLMMCIYVHLKVLYLWERLQNDVAISWVFDYLPSRCLWEFCCFTLLFAATSPSSQGPLSPVPPPPPSRGSPQHPLLPLPQRAPLTLPSALKAKCSGLWWLSLAAPSPCTLGSRSQGVLSTADGVWGGGRGVSWCCAGEWCH